MVCCWRCVDGVLVVCVVCVCLCVCVYVCLFVRLSGSKRSVTRKRYGRVGRCIQGDGEGGRVNCSPKKAPVTRDGIHE